VKRNIYCKELEKIIYTSGDEYDHFKQREIEAEDEEIEQANQERQMRCIGVSPDG
jgi:hypothetical protein